MEIINGGLNLLFLLLAAGILGMSIYALIHALRVPTNAFVSAGKLQKNLWLIILILATLFSAAGAWSYSWAAGDLDMRGRWLVEAQVTYSSGDIQTFGPTLFHVRDEIA